MGLLRVILKWLAPWLICEEMQQFIIVIIFCLSGCGVAVNQVIYSHPYIDGEKLEEYSFTVEKHQIKVKATNKYVLDDSIPPSRNISTEYYWEPDKLSIGDISRPRNRDVFFIELLISPQDANLQMIPENFVLMIDGEKLSGIVYGPVNAYNGSKYRGLCDFHVTSGSGEVLWNHPDEFRPAESLRISSPLSLQVNRDYCFAIKFKVSPPMPETDFSLLLDGIGVDKKIDFKAVQFEWSHN